MRVHDLLGATDVLEWIHDAPVDVTDVIHDSRAVHPGALFACVPGTRTDGHLHAAAAVERGATALLVERPVPVAVPQARVASVRAVLGPVAARVHHDPSRAMTVVGVTGTNGKTTTTHLIDAIGRVAGRPTAVLGTLGLRVGTERVGTGFTTPEAPELARMLADCRDRGVELLAMEVSSHALSERRVDGTWFAATAFTNLSSEHLDQHGSVDAYFEAKARLFTGAFTGHAVVGLDDPRGDELVARAGAAGLEVVTYALDRADADLTATVTAADVTGSDVTLHGDLVAGSTRLGLAGRFNVENALAAAALARVVGLTGDAVLAGLAAGRAVPGRFERVGPDAPVTVVVDYAHTPAGIASVLAAARAVGAGRVVAVFGCGGDRDARKRPEMGAAAGRGADVVVLTSDNPRSEDPAAIAEAAARGLDAVGAGYEVVLDRAAAIARAVELAEPGDLVMVLGKGAETTQQLADGCVPFDDREVAARILEDRWS